MPVPPNPVLRAAVRWLDRLSASGASRIRALFLNHPDFSDITPTQYDAAYEWLEETGLITDLSSGKPASHMVFDAAMVSSGAFWFQDADSLVREADELPEDALRAAEALGLTAEEAYAQVHATWGKVDTEERTRIGAAGELALVELLEVSVNARVEHVAAWSDGYGYDIVVHTGQRSAHLEVKSTLRRHRLAFHLSRNEYETMLRDQAWELVTVCLSPNLKLKTVAVMPKEWIVAHVPADRSSRGHWESCRLEVPSEVPVPGIPSVVPMLREAAPQLLKEVLIGGYAP
ncbi:hypothetical protein GCM10010145_24810 [Streptomyces ruber]|uniref:Protein NO VEIN C-terminal domain-containing protein n=2 Tax=Streptomyces TaxID=1883 RepID=A0A918ESF7_9ACTN|nr:DUF3883 domain-containing protein [Streptomyces ruber]GGQ54336.1 hypothetical protein GCM10010145_24810 [Streptomyces ruber]